jgi:hypothetical protein
VTVEPFATTHELASKLQTEFTVDQHVSADLALEGVSATVRELSGQTIWPAAETSRTWLRVSAWKLFLPHPPVVPVTVESVTVDGDLLDEADWRIDDVHGLSRTSGAWSGDVTVVYTHGFDDPPQSVRDVVLDVASRRFVNPTGLTQETEGPFSRSFGPAAGQGFRVDELQVIDRFRATAFG